LRFRKPTLMTSEKMVFFCCISTTNSVLVDPSGNQLDSPAVVQNPRSKKNPCIRHTLQSAITMISLRFAVRHHERHAGIKPVR
jgi:hypothetical protein